MRSEVTVIRYTCDCDGCSDELVLTREEEAKEKELPGGWFYFGALEYGGDVQVCPKHAAPFREYVRLGADRAARWEATYQKLRLLRRAVRKFNETDPAPALPPGLREQQ